MKQRYPECSSFANSVVGTWLDKRQMEIDSQLTTYGGKTMTRGERTAQITSSVMKQIGARPTTPFGGTESEGETETEDEN